MQTGDILTAKEADYFDALEELWVMVSDMIEGGRLRKADIPDDYEALVQQLGKIVVSEDIAFGQGDTP